MSSNICNDICRKCGKHLDNPFEKIQLQEKNAKRGWKSEMRVATNARNASIVSIVTYPSV